MIRLEARLKATANGNLERSPAMTRAMSGASLTSSPIIATGRTLAEFFHRLALSLPATGPLSLRQTHRVGDGAAHAFVVADERVYPKVIISSSS